MKSTLAFWVWKYAGFIAEAYYQLHNIFYRKWLELNSFVGRDTDREWTRKNLEHAVEMELFWNSGESREEQAKHIVNRFARYIPHLIRKE